MRLGLLCAVPGCLPQRLPPTTQYELPIQRGRDADATDKQVERGLAAMNELMELCNRFMLRRTSTVLKKLLPAKVEQVRARHLVSISVARGV
jgi:SNF2 family DNA or RNA helicase